VPRVSVVIPARDAAPTLRRTLDALQRQAVDGGFEVIVVDDGSSDDTVAVARAAGATVLEQQAAGPAQARNAGAAVASGEVLAFTDADCFPAPGWLAAGVLALEDADLVQGRVAPERPPGPYDRTLYVSRLSGLFEAANLFVKRDLFDRLGGFEEWVVPEIGKAFGEDLWFGWRALRDGARTTFAADAYVEHAVFERGPLGYIDERRRLRYFPAAVKLVPELREHFLHRGLFLSAATQDWNHALVGAAVAKKVRPAVLLAAPFAVRLARQATPHGRNAPLVAATEIAANVVGSYALLVGSIKARTPVF
jgi:glycosyltransferase involved in cell wall biosynthesis